MVCDTSDLDSKRVRHLVVHLKAIHDIGDAIQKQWAINNSGGICTPSIKCGSDIKLSLEEIPEEIQQQ